MEQELGIGFVAQLFEFEAKHALTVIVFSNTTPLIALASGEALHLLPDLFQRVHAASSVVAECRVGGPIVVPDLTSLTWLEIVPVRSRCPQRWANPRFGRPAPAGGN